MAELTPKQIVAELDKYIIGQHSAKKAVAIALRNRYRRSKLSAELKEDVTPKNIIMIGSTGVGKTEIARRVAKLVDAPFVKVEATKFTEVGYVGRDVESMVRDLVETAIRMVKNEKLAGVEAKANKLADEELLDKFAPLGQQDTKPKSPFDLFFNADNESEEPAVEQPTSGQVELREMYRQKLKAGELDHEYVEIDIQEQTHRPMIEVISGSMDDLGTNLQDMFAGMFPKRGKKRKITVAEARKLKAIEQANKLIDMDEVIEEAINKAEQTGIIFLDEIDKIATRENTGGQDVSRGGVQRDILPIVEGSTLMTKYGPIKTDHILFIAAGAFHTSKPSDLIPELQGRFPIRVELSSLTEQEFLQILIEPQNALIKQYQALLATEGMNIQFSENALAEIAKIAYTVNEQTENIGARRLHTILEKLLEDLLFDAPDLPTEVVEISELYVREKLIAVVKNRDLTRYIL